MQPLGLGCRGLVRPAGRGRAWEPLCGRVTAAVNASLYSVQSLLPCLLQETPGNCLRSCHCVFISGAPDAPTWGGGTSSSPSPLTP